jgi:undecaprenyl-diphosphatase
MHWLQTLDTGLFRFINLELVNPLCDRVMPLLSGNVAFAPVVAVIGLLLVWKGGWRGRLFVVMLALAVGLTDGLVCNTLKHLIARPRPFWVLPEARCLVGKSGSGSLPSSHAANWFAATMIACIYYRRSWRFMLPSAVLVSVSRVYNGVHYPSDILAGAILGAGTAAAAAWLLNTLWQWAGRCLDLAAWKRMPSLLAPEDRGPAIAASASPPSRSATPAGPGESRT